MYMYTYTYTDTHTRTHTYTHRVHRDDGVLGVNFAQPHLHKEWVHPYVRRETSHTHTHTTGTRPHNTRQEHHHKRPHEEPTPLT